jgi:UMF1 family MFS transporter
MGDGAKYGMPSVYGLQIGVLFSCIWQLFFLFFYTNPLMKVRPGPSMPTNNNFIVYSFNNLYNTLSKAKQLSQLFKFLLAWFIFSDGIFTISTIAILFFKSELGVNQNGLIIAASLAPLSAAAGNYYWNEYQKKKQLSTKQILVLQSLLYCVIPIYGLLGFFTEKGGLFIQSQWEIYPLAMFHGFLLGAAQSSCRVLFSDLMPFGHEAEFFSLYGNF